MFKRASSTVLLFSLLIFFSISITALVVQKDKVAAFFKQSSPKLSSKSLQQAAHSKVSNKSIAFSQAEAMCLIEARFSTKHRHSVFLDPRSTQSLPDDRYKVFIKTDPNAAMGDQTLYVCNVKTQQDFLRVSSLKKVRRIKGVNSFSFN
jgi:hypothetical protein